MTRTQVSMPDLVFFPLCLLLAAALVFFAINPFADRLPRGPVSGGGRNAEDVTVKGRELNRFTAGDFGVVAVQPAGPGGRDTVVRIEREATAAYQDPRSGPHIVLAEDLDLAFASRPVEVTIEARAAGDFGASFFEAEYFAKSGADSGWRQFPLTNEFQSYSFRWFPPRHAGQSLEYDYVGVRPVAPDKKRTMEIRSIRVHALGPKTDVVPAEFATGRPGGPLPMGN
jgi:hypothetical protein